MPDLGGRLVAKRRGLSSAALRMVAVAAAAAAAVVASGCGQGSERAAQVAGVSPAGTGLPAPEWTPGVASAGAASTPLAGTPSALPAVGGVSDVAVPTPIPSAVPGAGGGGVSEEMPDGMPGPGEESDGPSGPVGDTGVGGGGVGAGVVPGEGDLPGGLRLLAPPRPYEGLADEIFDLCDDSDAYTVIFARPPEPGGEMAGEERDAIAFKRQVAEVSCDGPGGRRYVYMSAVGPSGAFATVQAATEDHNRRNRYSEVNRIRRPPDIPLGYFGDLGWDFPLEDVDEVVLVEGSVLVRGGVLRGLVRNLSKTLFARGVTVTARPSGGGPPASGRFPLTVQPGERAFFEIGGWAGSEDPADIVFEVAAEMSERVDISRSFSFGTGGTVTTRSCWTRSSSRASCRISCTSMRSTRSATTAG